MCQCRFVNLTSAPCPGKTKTTGRPDVGWYRKSLWQALRFYGNLKWPKKKKAFTLKGKAEPRQGFKTTVSCRCVEDAGTPRSQQDHNDRGKDGQELAI